LTDHSLPAASSSGSARETAFSTEGDHWTFCVKAKSMLCARLRVYSWTAPTYETRAVVVNQ
jgi:hypothetical protein